MDREDNTHYFNLEYLNYSEPQVKDINAKPSKAFGSNPLARGRKGEEAKKEGGGLPT